jgi:flagellar hook-associated protein 2
MGMRIPGGGSGMISPKVVEDLIEAQKIPVETAKKRKGVIETEKAEVQKFQGFLNDLDTSLNSLKTRADFYRMKLESSHPDILDGQVDTAVMPGSYEFEVRGLAKTEKELAYGFPDKDQTPVGFGYMLIERDDKDAIEVVIEPDSTLQQVATQINDAEAGVRAMVVNTKYKPEAYRLLVVSEQSGKEAKVVIDEDTTFLEFKEQVTGRNLDLLFEDVPVTDEDNTVEELIDGVVFFAKRSEPGTRVQVNITPDIDGTLAGIKTFVEKYNQVSNFVHQQFAIDEKTNRAGILAADSTLRSVMRSLQGTFSVPQTTGGKYQTIAQIGITTDPKTGDLRMDEAKVKQALAEDYDGVAALFIRSQNGDGLAERMAQRLKTLRDPSSGAVRSRVRALDTIITNADKDIERRERQLEQREQMIRQKFTALEGRLSGLQAQGNFLQQRFGGGGGGGQGGGG